MSRTIVIEIDENGKVDMEGHNFKGTECEKFMKEYEKAIGEKKAQKKKYERSKNTVQARA